MQAMASRMKRYEAAALQRLTPRVPVIARIDGRAFHTFTRGCTRPYDEDLHTCMWTAAKALCADIQGCKMAYVQSDEISLLLVDYESINSQPHFDYEVPKLVSTAAATASVTFLIEFLNRFPNRAANLMQGRGLPTFDARFYNVPREDVANYFIWRQRDAERNSLAMLSQSHYSHKELHGKDREAQQDLLYAKGVNWNDLPTSQKRGVCVTRETYMKGDAVRSHWVPDMDIPIFSSPEGRAYIERFVCPQ